MERVRRLEWREKNQTQRGRKREGRNGLDRERCEGGLNRERRGNGLDREGGIKCKERERGME